MMRNLTYSIARKSSLFRIAVPAVILGSLFLSGCNGGASTTANPNLGGSTATAAVVGGVPQSALIQAFKIEMWPNLSEQCGTCHVQNGQSPSFARTDDINLAYNQAVTVTNMTSPPDSRLVSKVAGGHGCWLPSNSSCATVMTGWIQNWLSGFGSAGNVVTINPPGDPSQAPGASKLFPAGATLSVPSFEDTVYTILEPECSGCHSADPDPGQLAQSPFFGSSNVEDSYLNSQPYMNLDNPDLSRFVTKLQGNHQGLQNLAGPMETQIALFAGGITAQIPNLGPTVSGATTLGDCDSGPTNSGCSVASGGNRVDSNAIVLYQFNDGSGNMISDLNTTGGAAINLTLSGAAGTDYNWVGGYGIEFLSDTAEARDQSGNSSRIHTSITASGEYSIEAWAIPANVVQEDSNIISYSGGGALRNFTLGQTMYNYDFMHRSSTTDFNGMPATSTPDADEVLQANLQHVVLTFDPVNGRQIYVNGQVTNAVDTAAPGNLADWSDIYPLILGNEQGAGRPWRGILRLAAIHDRALTNAQIVQNFEAGVGEKYFMLFGISHIDPNIPADSYIMFEFSQIDQYGYIFSNPTYLHLPTYNGGGPVIPSFSLQGMRIGINGSVPVAGQAYSKLNLTLGSNYDDTTGQEILSNTGTVIAVEKGVQGADQDEFFIVFENIAGVANAWTDLPSNPPPSVNPAIVTDLGVRTFNEINATLSEMTDVPVTNPAVAGVFASYEQQLPTVENLDSFLGSHQMAIAQLALTYCDELVSDNGNTTRAAFFPGFNFNLTEAAAFDPAGSGRDQVILPLIARAMNLDLVSGNDLISQPDRAEVSNMLGSDAILDLDAALAGDAYSSLIEQMVNNCGVNNPNCGSAARTEEIVKATCAAAIGSAVMLAQ
jgi:hypothetical protein